MLMRTTWRVAIAAAICIAIVSGCSKPLAWPPSPLYPPHDPGPATSMPADYQAALEAVAGHYAHFDIVAYEDTTTKTPMRTFVISYGFTDLFIRDGKLYQSDRFCHAEQKINQKNVTSTFRDSSVQAIQPRLTEVELRPENGRWYVYRPETPTLLGISGDPSLPLPTNPRDPGFTDPDRDGHPGVTVGLNIAKVIKGEIYITRREIYSTRTVLNADGTLTGSVADRSEQFVIDASLAILRQKSNARQVADPGLNPIILVPVDDSIDTCEELMAMRDSLFPKEPEFVKSK